MKKLALLLLAFIVFTACSLDEDETIPFHVEFMPVESVDMPESFSPGVTYKIALKYRRPTDCHSFQGFTTETAGLTQTVAIQDLVIDNSGCVAVNAIDADIVYYDFTCGYGNTDEPYVFKFYKGDDAAGNKQFLEMKVPVKL